ncbi:MAG: hypothetical protein FWC65_02435 [Treponema sp.]|nr:hypothetical protein [Treponema sp.]
MKKHLLALLIGAALFGFTASSIWEGAAGVAAGGDLPAAGLYVATNSFPLNTVIDLTNLENGMTVRVVAAAPLSAAPGLIAMLSPEAASAVGLAARSLGRVRMSQPPDPVAFSRFGQGRASGDPDFDPAAFAAIHGALPPSPSAGHAAADDGAWNRRLEGGAVIVDMPDGFAPAPQWQAVPPAPAAPPAAMPLPPEPPAPAPHPFDGHALVLVPTDPRPPQMPDAVPDPAHFIPSIGAAPVAPEREYRVDPFHVINPIAERPFVPPAPEAPLVMHPFVPPVTAPVPAAPAPDPFPVFSAPMIHSLQAGMFYVQLAAYANADSIRYELARINRIDPSLGGEIVVLRGLNPHHGIVYQILIGPLNHGESGALLHRFRSTHSDAFIRAGS